MAQFPPPIPPGKLNPRTKFSEFEDWKLRNLVLSMPLINWKVIGSLMGNRTPRQCRERYKNYLAPSVRIDPWTAEEEALLVTKYREMGPKWSQMAPLFNRRTPVSLKNHHAKIAQHFSGDDRSEDPPDAPIPEEDEKPPPPPPLPESVVSIFRRTERAGDAWFSQDGDAKFGNVI
jgi:hypothetical protein